MNTKVHLVRRLEELPAVTSLSHASRIQVLIDKARRGYYHDFETSLPTPKFQLVVDLREAGLEEIAQEVMSGMYDDESPVERPA